MIAARPLVRGSAEGPVVVLAEPLSFWGGFDSDSGLIIDRRHPQLGTSLVGVIAVLPAGRGSSSSSSVLAEAIRAGTSPSGIMLTSADPIIALGAMVAEELYDVTVPVVIIDRQTLAEVTRWRRAVIEPGGAISPAR